MSLILYIFFMISHLLPTIFHNSHLPPILFYYLLSFFSTISHHLPFLSSPSLSLTLSLHLILFSHPFSHHPLPTSLPSPSPSFFITLFFLSTLSYHPLLSTPFSLSTLFHFLFLPSHPLSIRKLFSCCMTLSDMVKALKNLQVCY